MIGLTLFNSLKRKYGESIPDILTYLARIQSEADKIENRDEHLTRLQAEQIRLFQEALQLGEATIEHSPRCS